MCGVPSGLGRGCDMSRRRGFNHATFDHVFWASKVDSSSQRGRNSLINRVFRVHLYLTNAVCALTTKYCAALDLSKG